MARGNAVRSVVGQVFTKVCDCDAFDHNNNSVCLIIPAKIAVTDIRTYVRVLLCWQLSYAGYVRVLLIVLISVFPAPGLVRKLWGRRIRRQEKNVIVYKNVAGGIWGPVCVFLTKNPTI